MPVNIEHVQVVMGGNHGDTTFPFGASASVHLGDNAIIDFEVSVCELICQKDTGKLIKRTILPRLTQGLEIVATWHLHIERNKQGQILCKFRQTCPQNSHLVDMYVTSNPAFQAMALGKEWAAGW
jgi:hypothetical protein